MPQFKEDSVDIDILLLDPNNYRFQEAPDFVFADTKRFAELTVQNKAFERLRSEALVQLKNSILKNGFLPFERLVVTPYGDSKHLVLEGNRRLAALRWIASDRDAGADVPAHVLSVLKAVPVVVVGEDAADPALREALMGIRHVSGIRQWGGYQRAQLVATLKDKYKLDSGEVAQRLGMTSNEVNRRYRAFKALRQMMEHEEFSDMARPDMYPIFHEAVSLPNVRDWLKWNDEQIQFTSGDELTSFYELITSRDAEEGEELREPKISSYSQVRELRPILDNSEARKILLDPSRSFAEALAITKREEIANSWKSELIEAVQAMASIGAIELKRITADDLALLEEIKDMATELIAGAAKLRN